jgi:UDP-GlcNAc:undecaprenyl-phosphate/decaprenyl-phosphate GlcNAc-1-phosphate transferase
VPGPAPGGTFVTKLSHAVRSLRPDTLRAALSAVKAKRAITAVPLFLSFILALSITTALVPTLARLAPRIGLTDQPGLRKVHLTAVPRVGGIAMAAGILVATLLVPHLSTPVIGFLAGLVVLLVFGVWDDRVNLDWRVKFFGQFLAVALCMTLGGVRIASLNFDTPMELPAAVSWGLTFVFLVGVTNAVNLADGLDGLAGGLAFLCLCAIAIFGATTGNWTVTSLALIESGAILGFLRFNTHPARIFMGDGGSQMLGFSIGVLAILVTQGESSALSDTLPLLLLGLPILDTVTVMVRRVIAGESPFVGDRKHLHHQLLKLGFAHHEAVAVIYCIQVALFLLAYFLRFQSDSVILLAFALFAILLLGLVAVATQLGWQAHPAQTRPTRASLAGRIGQPHLAAGLARGASWTMCASLLAYAVIVITAARHVGGDISLLSAGTLALLVVLSRFTATEPASWLERLSAYLAVILLVYLDQTALVHGSSYAWASWSVIAVAAAAALVRFVFSERRLEVTALDVLVVFVALVVPNLPGFVSLPEDLPGGIVKAVVLLYVVEMIDGVGLKRTVPRALVAVMLGAIALRGLPLLAS